MKKSLTILAGLLVLLAVQVPALAQPRANINERISAIEEELNLLRDVAGEAATSASGIDKKLASIQKSISDAQGTLRRLEDLEAATRRNTEVLKVLYAQSQKLTAMEKEVAELAGRAGKKKLEFKGQLRVRPYFLLNSRDLNNSIDADDFFRIDQRVRLGVTAQATDYATINLTLQDARIYGAQGRSLDGSTPAFVHEAYASFTPDSHVDLRVGRQEWNFGAGRIIGNNDWESAGRAFDGLDLRFLDPDLGTADLLYAVISDRQDEGGDNRYFGGLYATGSLWAPFLVDLYALYTHDPLPGADNSFAVLGLRAHGQLPMHTALFYDIEASWQLGRAAEGNPNGGVTRENDHYAAAYHWELGYAVPVPGKPWASLFLDWSSADQNRDPGSVNNTKSSGWISLFPTRHAYLGAMDLFEMGNIRDLGFKIGADPVEPLKLEAALHYLSLVSRYDLIPGPDMPVDAARLPSAESYLGTELDFHGSWDFSENFQLAGGWSIFLPAGGAAEDQIWTDVTRFVTAPDGSKRATSVRHFGGDPAHYLWLQADLKF
jgi:hypothetical protein